MTMKVLFYGSLEEVAGVKEIEIGGIDTLFDLLRHLKKMFPAISKTKYRVSVNRETVQSNKGLDEGDQIALLPPFAGNDPDLHKKSL